MANHVTTWIKIAGNDQAASKFSNIVKQFEDARGDFEYGDTRLVAEVIFGSKDRFRNNDPRLGGAKWAFLEDCWGDQITLICGWDPAFGVGATLCRSLSSVDPSVMVTMQFADEGPNFVGASVWAQKGGDVLRSDSWIDASEYEFIDFMAYEELPESEIENYKTWEDSAIMQDECLQQAKDDFKAGIHNDFLSQYRGI